MIFSMSADPGAVSEIAEKVLESDTVSEITETISDPNAIESFIEQIKNIDLTKYEEILNPQTFSGSDLESFIVMLLILIAAYKLFHKAYKFAWWCIGLLFAIELGYLLSLSGLNNYIPFSSVFTYDIGVSVANFFAGTRVATAILWFHDILHLTVVQAGNVMSELYVSFTTWFDSVVRNNPVHQ